MNHEIYKLDNAGFTLAEITEMLGVRREVVRRAIKIQRDREREIKRYLISRNKKPEE
jgi:hypothetical protein